MKVLALDIATRSTGYSVMRDGKIITFGTVRAGDDDFLVRGQEMAEYVRLLVEKYGKFDLVLVEELKVITNQKVLVMLGIVQGMILRELKDTPVKFLQPSVWRKQLGLKGKREVLKRRAVEMCLAMGYEVANDDEAEAILINISNLRNKPVDKE